MASNKGRISKKMKVSTVIIHHKDRLIDKCLESLEGIDTEVIVVTTDETLPRHKRMDRLLTLDKILNNPSLKRNYGARISRGDYICFLDDDVTVDKLCIENMYSFLHNNNNVGMVYAKLYKADDRKTIDTSGSYLSWSGFLYETYEDIHHARNILAAKSACCMIKTKVFYELNGFDQDFFIYGEETDLSWRVWSAGYKVMVLPCAFAYHAFETALKPRTFYNQKFIHYHGCKNYLTMLIKNLPPHLLYIVLINAAIWNFMALCMLFRNWRSSVWIWQGIWYNIRNIRYILNKRRLIRGKDNKFYRYVSRNPSLFYYFGRFRDYFIHMLHG